VASALSLALVTTSLWAQTSGASSTPRPERRISLVFAPTVLGARDHGMCSRPPAYDVLVPCSGWELGIGLTIAVEGRVGDRWAGVRAFSAETELIGNSQPDPAGIALYGGLQRRTTLGTVRFALGPEVRHIGLFGVLAVDWFTTHRTGVGLEMFGFTGPDAMYGTTVRLSVGRR
jgi:hypothetical protein